MTTVTDLIEHAEKYGFINCPECGFSIEINHVKCGCCGWKNPLIKLGIIDINEI